MRLKRGRVLDEWLDRASEQRRDALYAALFSIIDGTWSVVYPHWYERRLQATAVKFVPAEVVMWRPFPSDPETFYVVYVGDPPL